MMTNKQTSSKSASFAKGGGGGMAGKQTAGPSKAGCTGPGGSDGGKFARGGSASMAGFTPSSPAKPK